MSKSSKVLGTIIVALCALAFAPWWLNLIKIVNLVELEYTLDKIEGLVTRFALLFLSITSLLFLVLGRKNTATTLLGSILFAPFLEEIVFRAPLIVNITEPSFMIGFQVVLASSVVFALTHWSLDGIGTTRVVFAFVWGVIFGITALVSQSIWLCMAIHCAVNVVMEVLDNRAQSSDEQPVMNET